MKIQSKDGKFFTELLDIATGMFRDNPVCRVSDFDGEISNRYLDAINYDPTIISDKNEDVRYSQTVEAVKNYLIENGEIDTFDLNGDDFFVWKEVVGLIHGEFISSANHAEDIAISGIMLGIAIANSKTQKTEAPKVDEQQPN